MAPLWPCPLPRGGGVLRRVLASLTHPSPRRGPLCCRPGGFPPRPAAPARTPPCPLPAAAALSPRVQTPGGQEGTRAAGIGPLATRSGLGRVPGGCTAPRPQRAGPGGRSALSTRRLECSPEATSGMASTPVLSLRPCTDSHVFSSSPPACWGGNPMTQAVATWDQAQVSAGGLGSVSRSAGLRV